MAIAAGDRGLLPRPACPRCGSIRLTHGEIMYADGPVPYNMCQECGYLDLQQLPTYISPKTTTKVDNRLRELPHGEVLPITRQAGVIDDEGVATGVLPAGPEHP